LFGPRLRRLMLLGRSLLLLCRSFLLQGRLMLRYRVLLRLRCWLMLGNRLRLLHRFCGHDWAFLGSGVHLLRWPLWLSLPHLFRGRLHGWPRLRNLLGSPRFRYRPFSLTRPQWRLIDEIRRRTLLYGWRCDRLLPLHGQRMAHHDGLRLTAVDGNKLCTVGAGGHPVLLLDPQLS
jgi:hypothetical protein